MKYLTTIALLFSCFYLTGQTTITGTVKDWEFDSPLEGVMIKVMGFETGTYLDPGDNFIYTSTDSDGNFSLTLAKSKGKLEVISSGFKYMEVPFNNNKQPLVIEMVRGFTSRITSSTFQATFNFPERVADKPQAVRAYLPSVVRVISQKPFGEDIGTGIVIGQNGQDLYLLTAHHVVAEATVTQVLLYRQKNKEPAEIVRQDPDLDLAILRIRVKDHPDFRIFFPAAAELYQEEAPVKSIGHPGGGFWKLNALNKVQEAELYEDERQFGITPQAIAGGCSGGPVFLANGALLGIMTQTSMIEGKCVKSNAILEWLKQTGLPHQYFSYPEPNMIYVLGHQAKKKQIFSMVSDQMQDYVPHPEQTRIHPIDNFHLGSHELTVAQFEAFITASGYITDNEQGRKTITLQRKQDEDDERIVIDSAQYITWEYDAYGQMVPYEQRAMYPVIHVSWNDALAYCKWLSATTGHTYRLPTQDELYYVQCRAAKDRNYTFVPENIGDKSACEEGINIYFCHFIKNGGEDKLSNEYDDGFPSIAPVGQFPAFGPGFHDLFGNVSEWCAELSDTWDWNLKSGAVSYGPNWLDWRILLMVELEGEKGRWIIDWGRGVSYITDTEDRDHLRYPDADGRAVFVGQVLNGSYDLYPNPNLSKVDWQECFHPQYSSNHTGIRLARDE